MKKSALFLLSICVFVQQNCGTNDSEQNQILPFLSNGSNVSISVQNSQSTNVTFLSDTSFGVSHSFDYRNLPEARRIVIGEKTYLTKTDPIFLDALGREATFRGFNISGNTKLVQHGFKPFQNESDAEIAFARLGKTTGSNLIRFTIAWEGVHTAVDTIDYSYLDAVIAQMKKAIALKMYVLVDYHQDLFSRNLFNKNSWYTGNGAPRWVTPSGTYPNEYCGIVCANWSQNNLTNEAIRKAFRNFWNDASFNTSAGPRNMQTEFLWQLGKVAKYIQERLSTEEFDYVLGMDPFNEPVDGGMEGLSAAQWDNQKLWPFYRRVRQTLSANGWETKSVYAEPLVFWNTNVGSAIVPPTGGGHLTTLPGAGFVFNSHFYDAGRMGTDLTGIDNATYFKYLDEIRKETRFLKIPAFLSEFGMWLNGTGAKDTPRMISAVYQAMEISDVEQPTKTRYADFYSLLVSGTQWHWDYYYDNHSEFMNGNTSKLITKKDAWNDENFSVIGNYGTTWNVDSKAIQRAYPRRSQGRILSFYYNTLGADSWNNAYSWGGIRPKTGGNVYFGDRRFAILIWKGRSSEAPSEIFLPPHFSSSNLIVVSDSKIYNKNLSSTIQNVSNESVLISDPDRVADSGSLFVSWDDPDAGEDSEKIHYVLIVDGNGVSYSDDFLASLQFDLNQRILAEKKSPVYLIGKMTYGGYPAQ
ncbi:cellulase family glycosylhydrolase [Leptospira kmetyi]|uniref:cellulase family glycosylhydrolase n=1 Tax=Leptospira kmetyi TaxID=408139 RepID=UPI00108378F7|nr:cellulase family glycosylhydrolase [Leptospira kmetyi]TGK17653.1 glycosyl hydrolase family 5 [Leptospira kmetyi]TGK25087.1 glycosyl hydrolase family 5 [Leptospira kmetyi]